MLPPLALPLMPRGESREKLLPAVPLDPPPMLFLDDDLIGLGTEAMLLARASAGGKEEREPSDDFSPPGEKQTVPNRSGERLR